MDSTGKWYDYVNSYTPRGLIELTLPGGTSQTGPGPLCPVPSGRKCNRSGAAEGQQL